jgi:DNA-binding NtrC family response regulator
MRRLIVLAQGEVRLEHLSQSVIERRSLRGPHHAAPAQENGGDIRAAVADLEKRSIEAALIQAGGNKSKAAAELGISRFALQRKLEKYDFGHLHSGRKGEEESGPGGEQASEG